MIKSEFQTSSCSGMRYFDYDYSKCSASLAVIQLRSPQQVAWWICFV